MTSDERDPGAFETLIGRLRESVGQQVQSVLDELAAAALADRDRAMSDARSDAERGAAERLAADVAAAELRAKQAAHSEGYALGKEHGYSAGKDEGFVTGKTEGFSAGKDEGFAAGKSEGFTTGKDEGYAEGKDHGYAAGKDHGYLAGKDDGYAAGTEDARAQAPPPAIVAGATPAEATARLSDGIRSIGGARSLSEILDALAAAVGREAARTALFLVRGSQFRAWRLVGFETRHDEKTPLEFSQDEAGILAQAAASRDTTTNAEGGVAPAFASLAPDRLCVAVPIMLSGEVVAVLYADQNAEPAAALDTAAIDVLTRHAARSLEAMTAFKAARALMTEPATSGPSGERHAADDARSGTQADLDASAQRYARLLVSEIKLYHEAAVVAGRRDGDLGQRLGDEIARARVLYEQRVPPSVRARADHFHDELVRTLANGDPALLEARS